MQVVKACMCCFTRKAILEKSLVLAKNIFSRNLCKDLSESYEEQNQSKEQLMFGICKAFERIKLDLKFREGIRKSTDSLPMDAE